MKKHQKEKYEEAEKYCEEKDYKKALPIYIELNNNYADLTEEITATKSELKKIILEQVNKLKGENNYSEAIKVIEEIKDFYKEDEEISKLLSEISKLKQNKEKEEKEKQKVEEIKSSIKVTRVWTATPNSAGGVDLYINWKNLSDKVIKYAYFTVVPYNSVNDIVTCKVVKFVSFGAFVEIEKGLEGLVHNSEITGLRRVVKPEDELKIGHTVNAKIINIDKEKLKIGLSIKEIEGTSAEYGYEEYISQQF